MFPPESAAVLPAALAIRLCLVVLTLGTYRRASMSRRIAFAGSAAVSILTGLAAAWFLLVLSVVATPIAIYSLGYVARRHEPRRTAFIGAAFNVLLGAVELVFVASDAVTFLFAWELMTLATAALVTTDHEDPSNRRAAYLYLAMSHVGTGLLFAGFLALASLAGSGSFAAMLSGGIAHEPARSGLFALFFLGFGVKAGIIPLHIWLPEAHPAAPTNISALMSGVLIKTGIYGIVRFAAFGLGTPTLAWGVLVLVFGSTSAVLGVLYALMQHDLKRLLAYHSIENIGIILIGLGAGMMAVSAG